MVFPVDLPSLETFTFSTSSLLNVNQVSLTSMIRVFCEIVDVPKVNNFMSELKGNTIQSAYVESGDSNRNE